MVALDYSREILHEGNSISFHRFDYSGRNELRCFLREGWRQRKQALRSFSSPPFPVLRGEYDNFALYLPPSLPPFRVSSRAEAVFDLTLIRFLSDGDSLDTRNRSWQKREGTERKLIIHPRLSFSLSLSFSLLSVFSLCLKLISSGEKHISFSNRSTEIYLSFQKLSSFRNPSNSKELDVIIVEI